MVALERTRLPRIILFAENVSVTTGFYREVFGFLIMRETDDDAAELDTGIRLLAIHKGMPRNIRANNSPMLSIEVDDVVGERERLTKLRVRVTEVRKNIDHHYFYGYDPAGNAFEITNWI